jgi:flagellar basal body rod protein FlgC
MRLKFRREPKAEHSYFAEKNFDGYICAVKITEDHRGLRIAFETNPGGQGSLFNGYIVSRDFVNLAKEMLRADPESAIRAFGAALQEFGAEKTVDADAA